jgi:hypothetical protein
MSDQYDPTAEYGDDFEGDDDFEPAGGGPWEDHDGGQFGGGEPEQGLTREQLDAYFEQRMQAAVLPHLQGLGGRIEDMQQTAAREAQPNAAMDAADELEDSDPRLANEWVQDALLAHAAEVAEHLGDPSLFHRPGFLKFVWDSAQEQLAPIIDAAEDEASFPRMVEASDHARTRRAQPRPRRRRGGA